MPGEGGQAIGAAEVADFLEKGLLDVLVDLFRAEPALCGLLGDLLRDERLVVRLGATALVETLAVDCAGAVAEAATAALLPLLESREPTHRGDAAYLLGVLGRPEALAPLEAAAADSHPEVREVALEALELIRAKASRGGGAGGD